MPKTKVQKGYLAYLESKKTPDVKNKYNRIIHYCSELKRKKDGSNNCIDFVVKLASRIYGFEELLKQMKIKKKVDLVKPVMWSDFSDRKN